MRTDAAHISSSSQHGCDVEADSTGSSSCAAGAALLTAQRQPLLQARVAAYCCFYALHCQGHPLQLLRQQLVERRAGFLECTAQCIPQKASRV
jgi:hypothetical protein